MAAAGVEQLLLQVFALFVVAKGLGVIAARLGAPSVVGEIVGGVALGLPLVRGALALDDGMEVLHFLAEVGVVFLLFSVGLETPMHELGRVGRTAAMVAAAGVAVPLGAGLALGLFLGEGTGQALFLGVALVATSVGITARVLSERGLLETHVARIILGAAVIDDILGLLVLAVAKGLAGGAGLPLAEFVVVLVLASAFVLGALLLGPRVVRRAVGRVRRGQAPDAALEAAGIEAVTILAIALCLGFSALAAVMGLAALVGAFFAGMAFAEFRHEFNLEHTFRPLVLLTSPLFFAFIGLQLDLAAAWAALPLALVVTLVAIATKWGPCAAAARSAGRWPALAVGAGMVPRGEVGIVVALVGLSAGVVGPGLYAVVVTMALLTTLVGPALLTAMLARVPASPAATAA